MKALLLVLAFFTLPAFAAEDPRGTSLGLMLGSPNGVTGRMWTGAENSVIAGLGWGLLDDSKFELYGDYTWNKRDLFEIENRRLDFYFGAGLELRTHSGKGGGEVDFGPRAPVGVSLWVTHPDLELFLEAAMNVGLVPSSDVFFDLNLGCRFTLF